MPAIAKRTVITEVSLEITGEELIQALHSAGFIKGDYPMEVEITEIGGGASLLYFDPDTRLKISVTTTQTEEIPSP